MTEMAERSDVAWFYDKAMRVIRGEYGETRMEHVSLLHIMENSKQMRNFETFSLSFVSNVLPFKRLE